MNAYINYDLHITQKGADYLLRANCSLAGQETGRCTMPFSDEEIQGFIWQDAASNSRGAQPKEIGRRLYDAIFQHKIGAHLRTCLSIARAQNENLRIRLHLDESSQLARLPWEYLYDTARDDFFALSIQTPIVRYVDLPIPVSSMQIEDTLHILVMIADPVDLQPRGSCFGPLFKTWKMPRKLSSIVCLAPLGENYSATCAGIESISFISSATAILMKWMEKDS